MVAMPWPLVQAPIDRASSASCPTCISAWNVSIIHCLMSGSSVGFSTSARLPLYGYESDASAIRKLDLLSVR